GSLENSGKLVLASAAVLTTGGNNSSTTFSGPITGNGGLTKVGTGTFTLTGTSDYTGPTTINAGTLLVNGSQPGSAVRLNAGGPLGGSGTVGAINVTGGTLSPGSSPGILSGGNLTLDAASTLHAEVNGPTAGSNYDQVKVAGNVSLAGKLDVALGFSPAVG